MRNILADSGPGSQLIFALFIVLASFLLVFLMSILIAIPVFHIKLSELSLFLNDSSNPLNIKFLKYLQIVQSFGLFILPAFLIGFLFGNNPLQYLAINKRPSVKLLILTIIVLLTSVPLINALSLVNQSMQLPEWLSGLEKWMQDKESKAQALIETFLVMDSIGDLAFNLFMIAILPAIGEELIFRGVLQGIFSKWTKNSHLGILIAAFLFSAVHFQFYGFLPRFALGIVLGYLFYWSKSLWIPITGHFVNNASAVIVFYIAADKFNPNMDEAANNPYYFGALIVSVVIVGLALLSFYSESKEIAKG